MHPDEQALMRNVIDNPDEDTPRLVIADWYEENGQPERAEFIRVQIQLEDKTLEQDPRNKLIAREKKILQGHIREWSGFLDRIDDYFWAECVSAWLKGEYQLPERLFRRGFLNRLNFETPKQYLIYAETIYAKFPIQELHIDPTNSLFPYRDSLRVENDDLFKLASTSYLTPIRNLHIGGWLEESEGILALFHSKQLTGLVSLNYDLFNFDFEDSFHVPLSGPVLPNLTSLSLVVPTLPCLQLLFQSTKFPKLALLEMRGFRVDSESANLLIQSEMANRIKEIRLPFHAELGVTPGNQIEKKLRSHFGNRLNWI